MEKPMSNEMAASEKEIPRSPTVERRDRRAAPRRGLRYVLVALAVVTASLAWLAFLGWLAMKAHHLL